MKTQENMLARYSILHELGQGAMGRVYAARERETGALVALKRLDPALLSKSDAKFAERFLKHARSAQALKHRNIVEIRQAGEAAGTAYVAMEMLEGESLRKIIDAGPLPVARAMRIAHDIASGLAHAHLEGVVHGGIKPSNVIVLRSGVAKITDFGIGLLAHAGQFSGYMSPEQSRGEAVDHRCDIFSLGALFYEMLTQRAPSAEPLPPSELNPHVPRALDRIVLTMLARQPASRMAGIPLLLPELQRLEEGLGLGAAAAASASAAEASISMPPPEPKPEPRPQTPGIKRLREREPMQDVPRVNEPTDNEAFDYQKAIAMMDRESRRQLSFGSRRTIWAPLIFVLALPGIGAAGYVYYSSSGGEARIQNVLARVAASTRAQEAPVRRMQEPPPATATEPAREVAPQRVVEATPNPATPEPAAAPAADPMPAKPQAAEPPPSAQPAQTESPVVRASEQPESARVAPVQKPARAMQATAKTSRPQPGGTARLILAVSPRGDIYVDGKHQGTTPPLTTFDLEPGMHRIEVRSGSRTPYLTYMTVQAGDVRRVRHDFNTAGAVHPPRARQGRVATIN